MRVRRQVSPREQSNNAGSADRPSISHTAARIETRRNAAIGMEERTSWCKRALSARTDGGHRGPIVKGEAIQRENSCSDAAYSLAQPDTRSNTALSVMTLDYRSVRRDGRPASSEMTKIRRSILFGARCFCLLLFFRS